jgi:hypothetical protein
MSVSMRGDVNAAGDLLISAIPPWVGTTTTAADGNEFLTKGTFWVTPEQAAAAKAFGWAEVFVPSANGYVMVQR